MKSTVVVSVLTLSYLASAHEPPKRPHVLKVTIYDSANLRREVLSDAVTQLRLIFGRAGIGLDVVVGHPEDEDAGLFTYVPSPPMDRVTEIACQALRNIRVKMVGSSPAGLSNNVLGMSSPFARAGLNVRLFNDHIRQAADLHRKPFAIVLSYAMAHEIGHVLLRSGNHGSRGIMSTVWTANEYARMDFGGVLLFTADEVKKMLADVGGIGCPRPAIFWKAPG
jgi:hypothetical protein